MVYACDNLPPLKTKTSPPGTYVTVGLYILSLTPGEGYLAHLCSVSIVQDSRVHSLPLTNFLVSILVPNLS